MHRQIKIFFFRRLEWLELINREDLNGKLPAHHRVCEEHFDAEFILTSPNRKVLKQNSVPKLLSNKKYKTRGSQATVETSEANTQCDLFQSDVKLQTPNYLSSDTPRKRMLKNDLSVCKKRVKSTSEPESSTFFRLCDKFLNKNLADIVKRQTKLKLTVRNKKIKNKINSP